MTWQLFADLPLLESYISVQDLSIAAFLARFFLNSRQKISRLSSEAQISTVERNQS